MKNILTVVLLCTTFSGYSQAFVRATEKYHNLNDIKKELEPYFERQRQEIGDEAFFHEGSEYNAYKEFLSCWEPLLSPHGDFSKVFDAEEAYWNKQDGRAVTRALGNADDWNELGPYSNNTGNLGPYPGNSRLMGIGPVEFVSIRKNNPDELLTGSLYGGLFYSNDAAANWTNIGSDGWENSGCGTAIFHPYLNNVVYACSGKESANSQPSILGSQGKVKRLVGGIWETIGDYNDFGGHYNKYYKLLADYLNNPATNGIPLRLYVATLYGLYYTDDANDPAASVNWTKDPNALLDGKIYDLEFVPNQTGSSANKIIATVYTESDYTWRVVYTTNRGLTWQVLPNHPASTLQTFINSDMEVEIINNDKGDYVTIEVSDADDDAIFIYAGTPGASNRKVYRFNWSTSNWTLIKTISTSSNFGGNHAFGVAQTDANYIAVNDYLGINLTTNASGLNTWSGELYTGHDDVEDIVWHPTSTSIVYVANHGGVYKSTDAGQTFTMSSQGLGVAEVLGLAAAYTDPGRLAIGLNHDGTQVSLNSYSEPFTPDWYWRAQYADALDPMIDYTNADHVWTKAQWDGGESFQYLDDVVNDVGTTGGINLYDGTFQGTGWEKASVLNVEDPSIVYYSYLNSGQINVLRSKNYGASDRESISNFASIPSPGYAIDYILKLITDPNNPDVLYVLVKDEIPSSPTEYRLFRNTNVNDPNPVTVINSWVELQTPLLNGMPAAVQVSYENSNVLYFSYSAGNQNASPTFGQNMFYKVDYTGTNNCNCTTTGVINCVDHTGNLPNAHGGSSNLILEKGSNEGAYVVTNFGVYFSNQTNLSAGIRQWTQIGNNLPHVLPSGAEINYEINKIRISFKGRGVWEHDLYCPTEINHTTSITHTNGDFVEVYSTINSTAKINSSIETDYRAGYQIILNPGFRANPGCDFNAFIHGCDAPGNSFREEVINEESINITSVLKNNTTLKAYPNPTNGLTTIAIDNYDANNANYKLVLYNSVGKLMQTINITGNKTDVDLSAYQDGIYLLSFTDGEKTSVVRISKTN